MAIDTKIQWCDSTLNLMMGCDGCELWSEATGVKSCYAGLMTERYGGKNKGWPAAFGKPQIFPERIKLIDKWPDLTGTDRPDKPWLNGYPRVIFLNDLGDTFTESLELSWLFDFMPELQDSRHIFIVLTKRVRRMFEFFSGLGYVPNNFWLMTTITSLAAFPRANLLQSLKERFGAKIGWSVEPMLSAIPLMDGLSPDWIVIGGESGSNARPFHCFDAIDLMTDARELNISVFVKQLGDNIFVNGHRSSKNYGPKGGDWSQWPESLRVRDMMRLEQNYAMAK